MEAEKIVESYDRLKGDRSVWEAHWQECADYALPEKDEVLRHRTPGTKKGVQVFDSTAIQSVDLLAGALHGMLTSPTQLFFELTTGDEDLDDDDDVREWLQDCTRRMHVELNSSNFQTEVHEVYVDEAVFGTTGLSIEETDHPSSCLRFGARPIAEFVYEESPDGRVDKTFRLVKWTARQIAMRFPKAELPNDIARMAEQGNPALHEVIHAIYERDPSDPTLATMKGTPKGMKIGSKYVLKVSKTELEESGYHEWPFPIPRWSKISGESYGRSPTMKALADIKMVNQMAQAVLKGAQKTVDPPLAVPDDGFIGPFKTTPGGLNYYRSGTQDKILPVFNDCRIDFGQQVMEDVRQRIRSHYYVDQLMMNHSGPQMTATEVNQRTEEKLKLMGPVLGRQEPELLQPTIDRIFGIMSRRKKFKHMPKKLGGRYIHAKYSSMIARAQRISEGNNLLRAIQAINPFVTSDPSVMDNFDGDAAARYIALDMFGLPERLFRDRETVQKMRKARAQAQQQQAQVDQQAHQADIISKAGPAIAQLQQAQNQKGQE